MEFKSSEVKRTTKQKAYREAMAEEDRDDETEEEEEDGGGLYGELSFVDNVSKKRGISFPNRKGSAGGVSPTCQAQNCRVDLTEAKPYHRRHKVCEFHSKASVAIVDGLRQRFCQQCSRFHELSEFDEAKRSCRRRLAGHNERRRKTPEGECSSRRG